MGKLILISVAVLIVVWLLRRAVAERPPEAAEAPQGDLVRCAHCGLHLPRAEAKRAGGRLYCGEEHARLGPRER